MSPTKASSGNGKKGSKRRVLYVSLPDQADRICSGCETCQLMCSLEKTGAFNPKKSRVKVVPLSLGITIPITCQQCEDPACRKACPEKAIVPHQKLNLVVVDEKKCTGCMACVGACPYGIMAYDPEKKRAIKCDLCEGHPACVQYCPSKVLELAGPQRSAEINRRRFASILATEDTTARNNLSGAEQIKTLPRTMTLLAAQATKQIAEGGK
jgi:anaerobic carbon-monoxide dehydrogenase iron sulfur subunit